MGNLVEFTPKKPWTVDCGLVDFSLSQNPNRTQLPMPRQTAIEGKKMPQLSPSTAPAIVFSNFIL
jgi:hypothetical protein